ncbi:MAG: miniconductance mechanosensitive channel MscM [Serratia symbiotica]|nr:miniconductance mechanosensitive channel MscM [Serratia symbiotica]
MRLIITILLCYLLFQPVLPATVPTEAQLQQEWKQAEGNKKTPNHAEIIEILHRSLNWISELKESMASSEQYKLVIDDFPQMMLELCHQLAQGNSKILPNSENLPASVLEQQILQTSSLLLEQARLLQQEQERTREISNTLGQQLQQQTDSSQALTEVQRLLQAQSTTAYTQAALSLLQAEAAARKAKLNELKLAQLSANNRQELARMHTEVYKKSHEKFDVQLLVLRNNLNEQSQREAELALERTEQLVEPTGNLPKSISDQLQINSVLYTTLNNQAQRIDLICCQQRQAVVQTLQVRQALKTIVEQAQWLSSSSVLGKTLLAQVSKLPDMPKPQQLDGDMLQLRVDRLRFENQLEKLPQQQFKHDDGSELTNSERRIADAQLRTQRELLNSLLSGCDTEIIELTKLKVTNNHLIEALNEIRYAAHRYLFWVPNVNPITLSYPLNVAHDLTRLLSLDTLAQLGGAFMMMVTSRTLIPILGALLLVIFSISSRKHYHAFLDRASNRVGKVTQDEFSLTLRTVFWSMLVALPLPVLWEALGFGLHSAWNYPVVEAIGKGVTATLPILWVCMIYAAFAHPQGLFIIHFRWPAKQVSLAMRYYKMSIWLIVPLLMALTTFDSLKEREFANTLGRLCFILLCLALAIVTNSLKRAGIPLHLDKKGSGDNVVNSALWGLLLSAPLLAALAASVGYLATSQALLARLETSVAIWFFLLVVYHIIRRWMLIQRRRIAFDRAKQRRADILAQRTRVEEETPHTPNSIESSMDTDDSEINLDAISAKSLQLVRSILTMIMLVSVIVLWSEIHSAFAFLGNISLWDVTSMNNGVESTHPITLGAALIAILVLIITMQLVRNLPALLELAVLQHLDLTPGTGYAITTITKYLLLLFGAVLSFSWIGIEWSKLQWVVTALSLGLGFGMQEIFSNFISGLIILFEKPIRIGDTVTIRNLTGSVTKINTRATTISDWDRKEIIVPNKAFITEQFINWSLSDTLTRVVLTVPAPADTNSEEVTKILINAAERCSLVLANPAPEVYLVDLQQGIQIFELRIYAAEMGHRMPLRHEIHQLILYGYRQHGITLPYPPFQVRSETLSRLDNNGRISPSRPLHNTKRESGIQ